MCQLQYFYSMSLDSLLTKQELQKPDWAAILELKVKDLLAHDFNLLISLLYRMDVSEERISIALADNPQTDAAQLITTLILEREEEKIKARNTITFASSDKDISPDEKW